MRNSWSCIDPDVDNHKRCEVRDRSRENARSVPRLVCLEIEWRFYRTLLLCSTTWFQLRTAPLDRPFLLPFCRVTGRSALTFRER